MNTNTSEDTKFLISLGNQVMSSLRSYILSESNPQSGSYALLYQMISCLEGISSPQYREILEILKPSKFYSVLGTENTQELIERLQLSLSKHSDIYYRYNCIFGAMRKLIMACQIVDIPLDKIESLLSETYTKVIHNDKNDMYSDYNRKQLESIVKRIMDKLSMNSSFGKSIIKGN